MSNVPNTGHCAATHPDDTTGCEGPADAVRIVDRRGTEVLGCVHHGARMLASLDGGRVYPGPSSTVGRDSGNGAAIDAYKRAQHLPPYPWQHEQPAPRTVTVSTVDHGPVALTCPPWCLGDHGPQNGGHLVDVGHEGPTIAAEFRGYQLLAACLVADPYATRPELRRTRQMVDLGDELVRLGPAGLDQLAAVLVEHAATLRHLARELAALDREAGR